MVGGRGSVALALLLVGPGCSHSSDALPTTCLTLRTPEGQWQAFLLPAQVGITGSSARFEFAVPAMRVDAAASFCPPARLYRTLGIRFERRSSNQALTQRSAQDRQKSARPEAPLR